MECSGTLNSEQWLSSSARLSPGMAMHQTAYVLLVTAASFAKPIP